MNNIIKLVMLDKALLKPYYKYYLIVFIIPVFLTFDYKSFVPSIIFAMSMIAMTCNYTFSIAEKNDLNRLYGLLPVTKKEIVTGRYFFTALLGLISMVIAAFLNSIILTILKVNLNMDELIIGMSIGIMIYSIFTAVQLPGFFKFGTIKGRFFTFIPFIGLFLLGFAAKGFSPAGVLDTNTIAVFNNPWGLLAISILLAVAVYGISIGITQKIYEAMEL